MTAAAFRLPRAALEERTRVLRLTLGLVLPFLSVSFVFAAGELGDDQ